MKANEITPTWGFGRQWPGGSADRGFHWGLIQHSRFESCSSYLVNSPGIVLLRGGINSTPRPQPSTGSGGTGLTGKDSLSLSSPFWVGFHPVLQLSPGATDRATQGQCCPKPGTKSVIRFLSRTAPPCGCLVHRARPSSALGPPPRGERGFDPRAAQWGHGQAGAQHCAWGADVGTELGPHAQSGTNTELPPEEAARPAEHGFRTPDAGLQAAARQLQGQSVGPGHPKPLRVPQLQLQCWGGRAAALPCGVPPVTGAPQGPGLSSQSPAIPTDVMHALLPPHCAMKSVLSWWLMGMRPAGCAVRVGALRSVLAFWGQCGPCPALTAPFSCRLRSSSRRTSRAAAMSSAVPAPT